MVRAVKVSSFCCVAPRPRSRRRGPKVSGNFTAAQRLNFPRPGRRRNAHAANTERSRHLRGPAVDAHGLANPAASARLRSDDAAATPAQPPRLGFRKHSQQAQVGAESEWKLYGCPRTQLRQAKRQQKRSTCTRNRKMRRRPAAPQHRRPCTHSTCFHGIARGANASFARP
jgi:hypothetical protein